MLDRTIDNILDIFYSKDRTKLYVLLLFVLGLILRLIAANNLGLSADDAGHAVRAVGIMEAGKLEEYGQSSALWYYIQETFFKIFGTSQFDSRTASAIFGSLSIILIFLFVNQVFKSKKIALIASAIISFSPFLIKMTLPEMDITANFFLIFSALFVFKFTESFKNKHLIFASVLAGIAIMIKVYSLFFAFSFAVFLFYSCYKKSGAKFGIKKIFIFSVVILIFCLPTITYNYLLYKDKGFVDYLFSMFTGIGKEKANSLYGWTPAWREGDDYAGFFFGRQKNFAGDPLYNLPGFILLLRGVIISDPIIAIFGILGVISLFFIKDKKFLLFYFVSITIPFVYLGTHIPMLKHQTFMFVFLSIPSAFFLSNLSDKIKKRFPKFRLRYLIVLMLIFNALWLGMGGGGLGMSIYTTSTETKIIDYKIASIPKDSFVVVDGRIFRGINSWMFYDMSFIESSILAQAINESSKYGAPVATDVYFVECVIDDCGWGTIKNQPDFNKSTEDIVSWFANNSNKVAEISGPGYEGKFYFPFISKEESIMRYRVYKTTIMLPPPIKTIAKSTHNFLMYPIGYDRTFGELFDDYKTHNALDKLIDKIAHWVMWTALFMSFLSWLFIMYLFANENETPISGSSINSPH